ncbi:MAG: general secretion pathway protein GspK [Sandarakinorhabdus sp.]|nr:general secretion pathway protein GspK [Sandarakinorhabdus sp.]
MTAGAMRPAQAEAGYAILAAVVAMAVLAMMSLAMIDTGRGLSAGVIAEADRARLAAAADAGLVVAAHNLAEPDRARRWSIDSRPHNLRFAGSDLVVTIEDERGKVPLNQLTDEQARTVFETLGASGATLETRTDSFLDWLDDDDVSRQDGAEAPYYARQFIRPRNTAIHSIEELILVRGMTAETVERLRSFATTYTDRREGFDDRFASPLALSVISGGGLGTPQVINRERELAGQRVAIELAEGDNMIGRPLMIRVEVRRPGGARLSRAVVIQLTGEASRPFVVRARAR